MAPRQESAPSGPQKGKVPPGLQTLPELLESERTGLLGDVISYISRYVVMTPAQRVAVGLWVVHTHVIDAAEQTPYLAITSPEKQCGKSRLMEVLGLLTARSWYVVLPSEPVVFRTIHQSQPTLLLDETDTIFNPRSAEKHEGLRALINAGNRPGATVPRCVGNANKVQEFDVFCAKALAGIGTLPDTVADRSVPIRLARKTKKEVVERFRIREAEPAGHALRDQLEAWAEEHEEQLADARPEMPDQLSDRMQDACEPLLAIAELVGGPWLLLAREALVELCTGERLDDTESLRVRLLEDIKSIFLRTNRRSVTTKNLLRELHALAEAPWGSWYGRKLEARDLAALLKPFGVKPQNLRLKSGAIAKGYRREPLEDAWNRYAGGAEQ
jgi:hypothetical protein